MVVRGSLSVEVKNEWSCTFTSPIYLHGMDKDKLNFLNSGFYFTAVSIFKVLGPAVFLLLLSATVLAAVLSRVPFVSYQFHFLVYVVQHTHLRALRQQ
jgi:hypothetical protein